MIVRNVTIGQLEEALITINNKYNDNVCWKREPEYIAYSNRIRFTLTVHDSSGSGGRISPSGRRIRAACWHVHGDFFDVLLDIEPRAVINTSTRLVTGEQWMIYKDKHGHITNNWRDWYIESYANPMKFSRACHCND